MIRVFTLVQFSFRHSLCRDPKHPGCVQVHSPLPTGRPHTSPAREWSRGGTRWMDDPAAPLPHSPSCQLPFWLPHPAPGTMASSEEDGAAEEKENNNKKKPRSALATAWLTFYNIAMTTGYVRNSAPGAH